MWHLPQHSLEAGAHRDQDMTDSQDRIEILTTIGMDLQSLGWQVNMVREEPRDWTWLEVWEPTRPDEVWQLYVSKK